MSYQINYTDDTNPLKPPIIVNDESINTTTDLTFVGSNFPNYGSIISENFLYLLENFTNSTPPIKPVQGQLWFDNFQNDLNIYDGINWKSVSNIIKSSISPTNPSNGDMWFKTTTNELFIFVNSWLLLNASNSSDTGMIVKNLIDTSQITHNIIEIYSNTKLIAIISDSTFTPVSTIIGFPKIFAGITISNTFTITGTISNSIELNGNDSSLYVRNDLTNTFSKSINVIDPLGINIGSDLGLSITKSDISSKINSNINLQLGINNVLVHIGSSNKLGLGLNNTSPVSDVDIKGVLTSDYLSIRNTTDTSINSLGGLTLSGNAHITGNNNIGGDITIAGGDIYPLTSYSNSNLGKQSNPFNNIFAKTISATTINGKFVGDFSDANVGSADILSSSKNFSIIGDVSTTSSVSFNGSGNVELNVKVSNSLILSQPNVSDTRNADIMLICRENNLYQTTKESIFSSMLGTIQVGMILPFAGSIIPVGYLLCDGSEISISTYVKLYDVIGNNYGENITLTGTNTFRLPDLRGRFPLGANNMSNPTDEVSVQSSSVSNVSDSSAQSLGGVNGSSTISTTGTTNIISVSTGTNKLSNNIMNPYQTINYIIYYGGN